MRVVLDVDKDTLWVFSSMCKERLVPLCMRHSLSSRLNM